MKRSIAKEKSTNVMKHLSRLAQEKKWISHYDAESDSFAMHVEKLSASARKHYVNDEVAVYATPRGTIQGIFIEYFTSNFLRHRREE